MLLILKKAIRLPADIWHTTIALPATENARQWLKLALFSLLISGLFSFVIVIARTPGISGLITDPLFARKSLVLHVNMALVVWFYAFLAVLFVSLTKKVYDWQSVTAIKLSMAGVCFMAVSLFVPSAEPVLVNYIPVLDHPLFTGGLVMIGIGLSLIFFTSLFRRAASDPADRPAFYSALAETAIRYAGILVVISFLVILLSGVMTPDFGDRGIYFERMMWGGGHILQFANVLGMLTVWLILIKKITGRELFSERTNRILLTVLMLPAVLSPVLMIQGTTSQLYYSGFTTLMRWFIFPVVTLYIIAGMGVIIKTCRDDLFSSKLWKNVSFNGFVVSVVLTVTGFIIGAMIRSSNTLIPAHYHASLGGVTVAYMVMVFLMLKEYGYGKPGFLKSRAVRWQPLLFGFGQTIFVIGFAYAGLQGMGRKMFGQDQTIYSMDALIGLGLMSIGGLLAIIGGLMFLYVVFISGNSKCRAEEKLIDSERLGS